MNHSLVPKHIVIRTKKGIEEILKKHNCTIHQLPIILKNDTNIHFIVLGNGNYKAYYENAAKQGYFTSSDNSKYLKCDKSCRYCTNNVFRCIS